MGGKGSDKPVQPVIVFDFNAMDPKTDDEKSTFSQVQENLGEGSNLLTLLRDYSGCEETIRKVRKTASATNWIKRLWTIQEPRQSKPPGKQWQRQ